MTDRYAIGHNIDSDFIVERIIRGGMSTVYVASHPKSMHKLAFKSLDTVDTYHEQIRAEVQFLATLPDHPHVIQVMGFNRTSPPEIVLEYAPGGSLRERIRSANWTAAERLTCCAQIATGLAHLHSHNVIHGDVKPENVLIGINGEAKLADFGLSRLVRGLAGGPKPRTGIAGTLAYLAPEMFHHEEASHSSDIYAFGLVIAEVMIGVKPSSARTQGLGELTRSLRATLGQAPSALISLCLANSPALRPSASALMDSICQAASYEVILEKQSAERLSTRAAVLSRIGRHEEAIALSRRAAEMLPGTSGIIVDDSGNESCPSLINLHTALVRAGQLEEAEEVAHKALALTPKDPRLLVALGSLEKRMGRGDSAEEYLRNALQLDPNVGYALSMLLAWAAEDGNREEVRRIATLLERQNSGDPKSTNALAIALALELDQPQTGLEFIERAVQVNPGDSRTWVNRGILQELNGLDGSGSFRRATEVQPDDAHARFCLARTLMLAGEFERALVEAHICRELAPQAVFTDLIVDAATLGVASRRIESYRTMVDDVIQQMASPTFIHPRR